MEQRAQLGHDQMLIGVMTMVEMNNLIMDDESSSNDDEMNFWWGLSMQILEQSTMMLIWMQFS